MKNIYSALHITRASLLLLCLFFGTNAQSQTLEEYLINDFQFDSLTMVNDAVRSVHIYSEREQISRYTGESRVSIEKLMEIEFNERAQKIYQRNVRDKWNNHSLGSAKTSYQSFAYDVEGRMTLDHESDGVFNRSYARTYTPTGKILTQRDTYGDYQENTTEYTWKNDSLVNLVFIEKTDTENRMYPEIKFDQKGRITAYKLGEFSYEINREEKDEFSSTEWKHYKNDTLINKNYTRAIARTHTPTFHYRLNIDGDTLVSLRAEYDSFGNLTYLQNRKWNTSYDDMGYTHERRNRTTYVQETVYSMKNFYIDGRIIKRTIYGTKTRIKGESRNVEKEFKKTERFHYDTEPLSTKFWPHQEEQEEEKKSDSKIQKMEIIEQEVHEVPPAPDLPAKIDD